jgi:hypothetical protein
MFDLCDSNAHDAKLQKPRPHFRMRKDRGLSSKIFKDCCTPDAGAELSFEPRRFVKAAKGRLFTVADR